MRSLVRAVALSIVVGGAPPLPAQHSLHVGATSAYRSITAAVSAAKRGDTVIVDSGLYREPTIVVDKSITLSGRGNPILDGENKRGLLLVTADDVTIAGFVLRNVGTTFVEDRAAIRVAETHGCAIEHNRIENGFFGIYLARVHDCRVTGNTIRGSATRETEAGNAIHLWTSRHITVDSNQISGHRDGIYLEFVHDSRIAANTSASNLRYGLHFMYSDGCRYEHNTFQHNGSGVAVMYTKGVTMIGNRFADNWGAAAYGLLLKEVSDARLDHNVFAKNTTGLLADGANRIVATANEFSGNGWALRLEASTGDGRFERNNFSGNTFDITTNSRSPSTTFAGNYWDEYRGYDLDRDGTGDVPHRPVRLFSIIAEHHPASLILMRSTFVSLLDAAERALPSLTPELLTDASPSMKPRH